MNRTLLIRAALATLIASLVRAQEPTPRPASLVDPTRVVGRVLGKPVTAGDLKMTEPIDPKLIFDARDQARWEQMGRICQALGGPLLDRFAQEHKLDLTPEEIAEWRRAEKPRNEEMLRKDETRLREIDEALARPDLAADQRRILTKQREFLPQTIEAERTILKEGTNEEIIRMFVIPWKLERELHRAYGGRVIFQQFGSEALDARARLFQAAEKRGDLVIDDPGVRHLFYYYSNMKHVVVFDGPGDSPSSPFAQRPWFFAVAPKVDADQKP